MNLSTRNNLLQGEEGFVAVSLYVPETRDNKAKLEKFQGGGAGVPNLVVKKSSLVHTVCQREALTSSE